MLIFTTINILKILFFSFNFSASLSSSNTENVNANGDNDNNIFKCIYKIVSKYASCFLNKLYIWISIIIVRFLVLFVYVYFHGDPGSNWPGSFNSGQVRFTYKPKRYKHSLVYKYILVCVKLVEAMPTVFEKLSSQEWPYFEMFKSLFSKVKALYFHDIQ